MASVGQQLLKTVSTTVNRKLFLGACYPSDVPKTQKVMVRMMDFDEWIKMYFSKYVPFIAHDATGQSKQGDIVLIEELPKRMTRDITHQIIKVVYPLGNMTDPITGKKCVRLRYRDDIKRINKLWGENPDNTFDYDTAPPRGWQEGRKDWSHKKPYRKFHEFQDRDQTEAEW